APPRLELAREAPSSGRAGRRHRPQPARAARTGVRRGRRRPLSTVPGMALVQPAPASALSPAHGASGPAPPAAAPAGASALCSGCAAELRSGAPPPSAGRAPLAAAAACAAAFALGAASEGARRRGGAGRLARLVSLRAIGEEAMAPAAAAAANEVLGRANLLRMGWLPFPRGRKRAEERPGVQTLEFDAVDVSGLGASPEEELAMLRKKGPMKVAMLGTRECPYQHQQEIELLSEARVMRGDHIFTSGSTGTNASVIKGALKARRPELLTVVLPQSMSQQDKDSQSLLRACQEQGVQVMPMPQHDGPLRSALPSAGRRPAPGRAPPLSPSHLRGRPRRASVALVRARGRGGGVSGEERPPDLTAKPPPKKEG
ncbi:unnamed protein product, partial [Prorocentrum cordatum]